MPKKNTLELRIKNSPELLKNYLQHLRVIENKSERTVKTYYYNIKYLLLYLIEQQNAIADYEHTAENEIDIMQKYVTREFLQNVTTNDILNYLYFVQSKNNSQANTRKNLLSSYNSFYNYLMTFQGFTENPASKIPSPKKSKTIPKFLTLDQSKHLLDTIYDNTNASDKYGRTKCMIVILINCGLRISELANIKLQDIVDDRIKIHGKGNKERFVYMNDLTKDAVNYYLDKRLTYPHLVEKDYLFISEHTGKHIGERQMQNIIKKEFELAGLGNEGFSAHKLRHTTATLMYQNGTDIRTIQALLGHESLATTQIYTHIDQKQVKEATNNNPLANYRHSS